MNNKMTKNTFSPVTENIEPQKVTNMIAVALLKTVLDSNVGQQYKNHIDYV